MAKAEVNKSAAIREALTANPKATAREVIDSLAASGIKVNSGLFYIVKGKMRRHRKRQMRQKVAQTVKSNGVSPIELIRKVKGLAAEVGGMGKLKQLLEVLSE
jgi:hypothetical protein